MRLPVFLMLVALALMAIPSGQAVAPGTLYMDSTVLAPSTAPCQSISGEPGVRYPMVEELPAATGKAYVEASAAHLSCPTYFDHEVAQAFTFGGDVTVDVYVGCDEAMVVPPYPSPLGSWAWTLRNGAGTVAAGGGSETIQCTGGTTYVHLTQSATPAAGKETVAAGDVLSLQFDIFAPANPPSGAPQRNLYVVTGAASSPSGITAPGIPPHALGAALLDLLAGKAEATAPPGGSTTFDLVVRNAGTDTVFDLSALGLPAGYTAAFAPPSGSIAHNASAPSTLTVKVPAAATPTTVPFQAKVTAQNGANKTVALTLRVGSTQGPSPLPSSSTGPSPTSPSGPPTGSGSTAGDGKPDTATTSRSSPAFGAVAALACLAALVARRRMRV